MTPLRTLASVLFLVASPAFAGWSMTQVVSSRGGQDDGNVTRQKLWLDGSMARVEFESSDNPMMPRGSFLLIREGGRDIVLVNPDEKTYARLDVATMAAGMDSAGAGMAMMEMKVENPKVEKVLEEPGGTILGRATTHCRYHTAYTQTIGMAMMKTAMATDVVEDVWTAPDIAFGGAGRAVARLDSGGPVREIAELERSVPAEDAGLPLKRVVVTKVRTTAKGGIGGGMLSRLMSGGERQIGKDEPTTTTTTVEALVEVTLAPAFFEIPAGYAETQMMQRGPAMPDLGGGQR